METKQFSQNKLSETSSPTYESNIKSAAHTTLQGLTNAERAEVNHIFEMMLASKQQLLLRKAMTKKKGI